MVASTGISRTSYGNGLIRSCEAGGNYFKTGNSRMHFLRIANYTTWTLCMMLRKKYKKRSKGWRDHPPSWFYTYHGLFKLYSLVAGGPDRYGRLVTL